MAVARAHPGDHAFLRVELRGQEIRAELEVPNHVLVALDKNGDFMVSPEEMDERKLQAILANGLEFSSRGVGVQPTLEPLPQKSPAAAENPADAPVGLRLTYRWPWEPRGARIRFALFAQSPEPDCTVIVRGHRSKLAPGAPSTMIGEPESSLHPEVLWLGWLRALTTPLCWGALLAMLSGAKGKSSLLGYLVGLGLGVLAAPPALAGGLTAAAAATLALAGRQHPLWLSLLIGLAAGGAPLLGLQATLEARAVLGLGAILCQAALGAAGAAALPPGKPLAAMALVLAALGIFLTAIR